MLMSVLGAVLAGALASLALPFLPFAAALTLAAVVGAGWAIFQSASIAAAVLGALVLLAATQVGYGFGLLLAAAADQRKVRASRASKPETDRGEIRDLRFGKES